MFVIRFSVFHPSFDINLHKPFKRSTEFRVHCVVRVSFFVKTWMEGTHDTPYKTPYFFVTTEPNRMGFFCRDVDN